MGEYKKETTYHPFNWVQRTEKTFVFYFFLCIDCRYRMAKQKKNIQQQETIRSEHGARNFSQ